VKSKNLENQDRPAATLGNQKWKGNAPNFNNNPIVKIKIPLSIKNEEFLNPRSQTKSEPNLNKLLNIINEEPTAWKIKYLIADSVSIIIPR
jgi:hypothetical protein